MRKIGVLSESLEDYLEIIFNLISEKRVARVKDIAKLKDVRMASVTGALKRLAQENLIEYKAREFVLLTPEGENLARQLVQRHEFLTNFLVDILKVEPSIAEEDACAMEHYLHIETIERFAGLYEFLTSCVWDGEPILGRFHKCAVMGSQPPDDNGCKYNWHCSLPARKERLGAITLAELNPGETGRVIQLPSPQNRYALVEQGILPGTQLLVEQKKTSGDIQLRFGDSLLSLSAEQSRSILVVKDSPSPQKKS